MPIQPFVKCSEITELLSFYTEVLDFNVLQAPDHDPTAFMSKYALLERKGDRIHLSSHSGDGAFGNLFYIPVEDVDIIYNQFIHNGLQTEAEEEKSCVVIKPVEQTWGMKEFSVADPDGNRITFGHEITFQ